MAYTMQSEEPRQISPQQKREWLYQTWDKVGWAEIDRILRLRGRTYGEDTRVMPERFQPDHLRRFNHSLWIVDDFLPAELFSRLQQPAPVIAERRGGWSVSLDVVGATLEIAQRQRPDNEWLSVAEEVQFQQVMREAATVIHRQLMALTKPDALVHYHSWFNTGPILNNRDGGAAVRSSNEFHMWHYDCDVLLKEYHSCIRFPIWSAVLFTTVPEGKRYLTQMEPGRIDQKVVARPNRLLIFDPRYVHRVVGPDTGEEEPRSVFVVNGWDYFPVDPDIEWETRSRYGTE